MKYTYAVSMVTENKCRVLQRVVGIFSRYRLEIENINGFEINNKCDAYFNIVFQSDDKTTDRVMKQLQRIIELLEVKINSQVPLVNN